MSLNGEPGWYSSGSAIVKPSRESPDGSGVFGNVPLFGLDSNTIGFEAQDLVLNDGQFANVDFGQPVYKTVPDSAL